MVKKYVKKEYNKFKIHSIRFNNYSCSKEGLPKAKTVTGIKKRICHEDIRIYQNNVVDITEDDLGFMWLLPGMVVPGFLNAVLLYSKLDTQHNAEKLWSKCEEITGKTFL